MDVSSRSKALSEYYTYVSYRDQPGRRQKSASGEKCLASKQKNAPSLCVHDKSLQILLLLVLLLFIFFLIFILLLLILAAGCPTGAKVGVGR
jgi:hypothetical protein